jgi:hypothetical protein
MAESAVAAASPWMPNFSEKSGKRRFSWHAERLTAGLPDVPTGGALHSHLIRRWGCALRRGNCLKNAFKAPTFSISPAFVAGMRKYRFREPGEWKTGQAGQCHSRREAGR